MPYAVYKRGERWVVINKDTKDVKGTHDTRAEAVDQMQLLYHVERGGKLTKTKK